MAQTPQESRRVLLTDHPWPGTDIEAEVLGSAGLELVEAPEGAGPETLAELASDVIAIVTCWALVTEDVVMASPHLRTIARLGIGLDNIDLDAAARRNVTVTRVPDYCVEEVSDHVVGFIHAWARGLIWYARDTAAGRWEPGARQLRRVSDLTVGLVGIGNIGSHVAQKMGALGSRVLGITASRRVPNVVDEHVDELEDLLSACDVISLHVPLTDDTQHLLSERRFAQMRPGSLLINTSRGGVVDTDALVAALDVGRPGAAALDVVEGEPSLDPRLRDHPEIIVTPHVAFSSDRSVAEVRRRACEEVVRVLAGEPAEHPVVL